MPSYETEGTVIVGAEVSRRRFTRLIVVCMILSVGFIILWFVGQEASADPTLEAPAFLVKLYPGTWPPVGRGFLWLFVAATTVGFNLTVMYPRAETKAGRIGLGITTGVTVTCFIAFAIGSFANAPWSVIH